MTLSATPTRLTQLGHPDALIEGQVLPILLALPRRGRVQIVNGDFLREAQ